MKKIYVYLKPGKTGREFTYALKSFDDIECWISFEYKKDIDKRSLTEVIAIEARELTMLGNIVKKMFNFIDNLTYSGPSNFVGHPGEKYNISEEEKWLIHILHDNVYWNEEVTRND